MNHTASTAYADRAENDGVLDMPTLFIAARAPILQYAATRRVKSLITRPRHGEVVRPGGFTVHGVAWSGESEISRLELSTNGGRSWQEAELFGTRAAGAWRRWKFLWNITKAGRFILMSRATDSRGNPQPANLPWNFRGYANNSVHALAVEVPSQ